MGKKILGGGMTRIKGPEMGKYLGRKGKQPSAAGVWVVRGWTTLRGARPGGEEDRPGSERVEVPKFLWSFPCAIRVWQVGEGWVGRFAGFLLASVCTAASQGKPGPRPAHALRALGSGCKTGGMTCVLYELTH